MCELSLKMHRGTVIAVEGYGLRSCEHQDLSPNQEEGNGIMKFNNVKKLGIAVFAAATLVSVGLLPAPARSANQDDAATTYKAKCVACHGAKAEKKFAATLPEAEMVQAVMTGKKADKPPNMPAYGVKGVTEDQAKALVAYMKSLQ
jgi:mono/diheme cytochrome c family protein